ncbi:MAG: GNAT family N-acetyltransferase [bacterium]
MKAGTYGDEGVSPAQPSPYFAFALREEPEGFWVAESASEIVGYTHSWVRGALWFLAHLFVSPDCQGKGVGRNLLSKALEYGSQGTNANRSLVTFAYNPTSISLYMR